MKKKLMKILAVGMGLTMMSSLVSGCEQQAEETAGFFVGDAAFGILTAIFANLR